jgi:hypothetical protein
MYIFVDINVRSFHEKRCLISKSNGNKTRGQFSGESQEAFNSALLKSAR